MAKQRRCAFCGSTLAKDAHRSRRYCDNTCRARRSKPMTVRPGNVVEATETAIKAAVHLTDMDAGAVSALRVLAKKLDQLADESVESLDDLKAKFDNVTIPTYLKFCESLGLTPAGRARFAEKKPEAADGSGNLGRLRSVPRPA